MNTFTHVRTSFISVLVLTGLALVALSGTLVAGMSLVADRFMPGSDIVYGEFGGFLTLLGVEAVYLGFAAYLARKRVQAGKMVRYAMLLQLQALVEGLVLGLTVAAVGVGTYLLIGLLGDQAMQEDFQMSLVGPALWFPTYAFLLSLPALSMLAAAWRLHALMHTPQALPAAVDGSLVRRELAVGADAGDLRHTMLSLLERLTDRSMPGLGRPWYSSHPQLRVREVQGSPEYELLWATCPMKLVVSLHAEPGAGAQVLVRSVLRGGWYRLELCATPLDALAQMK